MADNFPLKLFLVTFAGWVNRYQAQAIGYLVEEKRVLREQMGNRRLRLTDDQRRLHRHMRKEMRRGNRLARPSQTSDLAD